MRLFPFCGVPGKVMAAKKRRGKGMVTPQGVRANGIRVTVDRGERAGLPPMAVNVMS